MNDHNPWERVDLLEQQVRVLSASVANLAGLLAVQSQILASMANNDQLPGEQPLPMATSSTLHLKKRN